MSFILSVKLGYILLVFALWCTDKEEGRMALANRFPEGLWSSAQEYFSAA